MKLTSLILFIVLCLVCLGAQQPAASQESPAQAEIDTLITSYVEPYCKTIKGDETAFRMAALPYGPLDLQIEKAQTLAETFSWKGFYLGITGAAANIDVLPIPDRFSCGQGCTDDRKAALVKKLPEISALAKKFHAATQVNLLAKWGINDAYRINNVMHLPGRTREALPSTLMGFVPSGKWRELRDTEQYLAEIKLSKTDFVALFNSIEALKLAALVRNKEGYIKVVLGGIGNNEAGLIFHQRFFAKPSTGPMAISNSFNAEYPLLSVIQPGIIYYEKYAY